MAAVVLEMQAGTVPGIVSDSEASGPGTRRNGDLWGEGGTEGEMGLGI